MIWAIVYVIGLLSTFRIVKYAMLQLNKTQIDKGLDPFSSGSIGFGSFILAVMWPPVIAFILAHAFFRLLRKDWTKQPGSEG